MKYKLIILFFNFFMILSFFAVFFLPVSVLGWEYIAEFWGANWILPVLFFVLIISLNIFFIASWSILKYVENGDWASVIPVLEKRIYERNIITYSNVRLLIHSCLLLGFEDKIIKLEKHLKENRKRLYRRVFLMFCSARLLSGSRQELESYLEEAWKDKTLKRREWIGVNYAFILIAGSRLGKAYEILDGDSAAGKLSRNPVLDITRLYLLFLSSPEPEREKIGELKNKYIKKVSPVRFDNCLEREKGEMHVLFLSKIIDQAREWAYNGTLPA